MSQKNFAITPSVSISRSKFKRPSQHKTAFNLGELVPIYVDADILPGDTVSLDLASLIRMSTPIAPIMDNIYVDYYAFFVPHRIVWDSWKQFMGENTSSFGAASEPNLPTLDIAQYRISDNRLGDYMGLPTSSVIPSSVTGLPVSALPGRAYYLIFNEWFRDQNVMTPYVVNTDGQARLGYDTVNSTVLDYNRSLEVVCKESDYFTRALPYAQKGAPVSLPLGTKAPVLPFNDTNNVVTTGSTDAYIWTTAPLTIQPNSFAGAGSQLVTGDSGSAGANVKIFADLSNATAATINQLRFAFQYQKFLEKDALYGTRYWEILKGHFGISAPDASLQRPELLGHFRQHINIDQVLQTSESGTTALGTPGANSVSGKSDHLISKSFVEHGTLLILACARHDQTYGQGVNRMWTRVHRTDYYFPVFANLGAQEIKVKELYCGDATKFNNIFGYQEAWAEYRYRPSICTSILNPSHSSSLSFWTLTNNFGSAPTLSGSFLQQDRTNIQRALTTGNTGPDFIADFYFDATYVRPMPMYSIPGLIDHH